MITPRIKALFQFIEFLHSNIENFKQYDEVLRELHLLHGELLKLSSKETFKDKLKFNEVEEQFKEKLNVIQENIIQPLEAKATELNICDLNRVETLWNWNIDEVIQLKENFSKDDLPEIFHHKNKYLEYRTATKGESFFSLFSFFIYLDDVLKALFDFFKETDHNEFEPFETKAVQVNDVREALKLFQQDKFHKFELQNNYLPPSTIQQQTNSEPLPPQSIVKQKPEQGQPETLSSIITHKEAETIVSGIKTQYKNIKGKHLKLLLMALQDLELLPNERIAKAFHGCCKREFDWDVASYPAMNDYQFNEYTDKIELDNMKKFLEKIIQTK